MSRSRNAYRLASWWLTRNPTRRVDVAEPQPEQRRANAGATDGDGPLRFGLHMEDLDRCARIAVRTDWTHGTDAGDRYDAAWSAIAEAVYSAEDRPSSQSLIAVGRTAIYQMVRDHQHHHGFYRNSDTGREGGAGTSPAFCRFWWTTGRATPSPEAAIVDRLGVDQILPVLTDRQRQVIVAMAALDDGPDVDILGRTAAALGMTRTNVIVTLSHARRRFLYWWHEGEMPSRPWGQDKRGSRRNGTDAIRRRARERSKAARPDRVLRPTDRVPVVRTGDRTHCPAGHPYDEANTYVDKAGHRHCRQCKKDRRRVAALQGRRI